MLILSFPLESAELPRINQPEKKNRDEDQHVDKPKPSQLPKDDRPGKKNERLHVEDHEQQREQIKADVHRHVRRADRLHPALIGDLLTLIAAAEAQERAEDEQVQRTEPNSENNKQQDIGVLIQHQILEASYNSTTPQRSAVCETVEKPARFRRASTSSGS